MVDELLETWSHEGQLISIRKVRGHAKARDARLGQVLPQDKFGNDEADRLACAGADERAVEVVLPATLFTVSYGDLEADRGV